MSDTYLYKDLSEGPVDFSVKTFVGCKMPKKLKDIDFRGANMRGCDFSNCMIHNCNFSGCTLDGAVFDGAVITNCIFFSATMVGVEMGKAKANWSNSFWHETCPKKGAFTAFKKVNGLIVELLIPKDAKRTTEGCTRKCRAEKAKVVELYSMDGEISTVESVKSRDITYVRNKTVSVKHFDEERFNNNGGIYFFINFDEAVNY